MKGEPGARFWTRVEVTNFDKLVFFDLFFLKKWPIFSKVNHYLGLTTIRRSWIQLRFNTRICLSVICVLCLCVMFGCYLGDEIVSVSKFYGFEVLRFRSFTFPKFCTLWNQFSQSSSAKLGPGKPSPVLSIGLENWSILKISAHFEHPRVLSEILL